MGNPGSTRLEGTSTRPTSWAEGAAFLVALLTSCFPVKGSYEHIPSGKLVRTVTNAVWDVNVWLIPFLLFHEKYVENTSVSSNKRAITTTIGLLIGFKSQLFLLDNQLIQHFFRDKRLLRWSFGDLKVIRSTFSHWIILWYGWMWRCYMLMVILCNLFSCYLLCLCQW